MPIRTIRIAVALVAAIALSGAASCAPVGSDRWCAKMKEKPKGDWSVNEAADYAEHCVFK